MPPSRMDQFNGSYATGGTDYVYQSFPPISSARRHVFHSDDRAPWIMSNTSSTPIGALHYDNDSVTILEGQWQRRSVKSANRGSHLQWAMTTLKSVPSEAEKHGLIHILALCWETLRYATRPTPPELCCNPGTCPRGNVTPQYSGTGSILQNLITVRVVQHSSLRSSRNIRPNKQAPADGLHGCIPSWFHYALSQAKQRHPVFPFNSVSPKNVHTAAAPDKNRITAVHYEERLGLLDGATSLTTTEQRFRCSRFSLMMFPWLHPRLSAPGVILHLISGEAVSSKLVVELIISDCGPRPSQSAFTRKTQICYNFSS